MWAEIVNVLVPGVGENILCEPRLSRRGPGRSVKSSRVGRRPSGGNNAAEQNLKKSTAMAIKDRQRDFAGLEQNGLRPLERLNEHLHG